MFNPDPNFLQKINENIRANNVIAKPGVAAEPIENLPQYEVEYDSES